MTSTAGEPAWRKAELRIDGVSLEVPSTSHFTIVDSAGNVASMTTSVENQFGSRLMVDGFLLNNQLTDFAFSPVDGGINVANRVEPGKRPRSSMSPTIVLQDGKPLYALGSPGGSNIISYVATTLIGLIDWKMDVQSAVAMPHLVNRFGPYDLEAGTKAEALAADLSALGYNTASKDLNSGLHALAWTPPASRAEPIHVAMASPWATDSKRADPERGGDQERTHRHERKDILHEIGHDSLRFCLCSLYVLFLFKLSMPMEFGRKRCRHLLTMILNGS